ncbi:hypothetical protein BCR36DRAFT_586598 [Piromyces finnis]|uniref:Peptidase C39-like domain-containing protein n=1 Tax=Piromyces finnis TaxID=1754191 RepID=A0A1Y1V107_9FUNG|nr:hypothetical protein BCR36DRAFT_586598 [Piromyces finnis]|eukprot:ORX43661.1 hypothetical protein BCR36DRAFT_586598 [Piromyces finnis]
MRFNSKSFLPLLAAISGCYGAASEYTCTVGTQKGVCLKKSQCVMYSGQKGSAKPYEFNGSKYSCPNDPDADVWCCIKTVSTLKNGKEVLDGRCLNTSECTGSKKTVDTAECPGSNKVKLCISGYKSSTTTPTTYPKASERACRVGTKKGVCVSKSQCVMNSGQSGSANAYEYNGSSYSCPYDSDPNVWCCVKDVNVYDNGKSVKGTCLNINDCSGKTVSNACPGSSNVKLCLPSTSSGSSSGGSSGSITINSTRIAQCDSKWGSFYYDNCSGCTICNWGCLICSLTEAYNQINGKSETPQTMCNNKKITFVNEGDVDGATYSRLGFTKYSNPSLSTVYNSLKKGYVVPFGSSKPGNQHWVVVYGFNGDPNNLKYSDFLIHDPGSSNRSNLQHLLNDYYNSSGSTTCLIYSN